MKAIFIPSFGGHEVLEQRELPDPKPKAGEVSIRVRAAGVNFADLMMRSGRYVGAPPPPFVPGYELAGQIDELGAGVSQFKKGDRVYASVRYGAYAEKAACPAIQVLPIPEGNSFEEAAALPVNYMTAYHALFVLGNLRQGSSVLVHQAAGGVGLAVIQLAKTKNAKVYGTASAGKHAFLKQQGIDAAIDYRTEDFEKRVMELTGGKGVQLALDPVGGDSFRKSYRCLGQAGLLVAYGLSAASDGGPRAWWSYAASGFFSPLHFMLKNKGITGFHLGIFSDDTLLGEEMGQLLQLWKQGKLRPHVDKTFPAAQAAEAHRYIQERRNIGKVVLTF